MLTVYCDIWVPLIVACFIYACFKTYGRKHVTARIDSLGLSWLQQAIAIPFIVVTLFFCKVLLAYRVKRTVLGHITYLRCAHVN